MKILLVGYGAMGQNLEKIITTTTAHQIIAIKGKSIESNLNLNDIKDFDVLIDFSHPNNLSQILDFISERKKPAVLCTTGYNKEQLEAIKTTSKEIAILYSRNMSIGISVMKKVIKEINEALDFKFDIEITEIHHNRKLDAPSGTALMLAESLKEDESYQIINREHQNKKREKEEIAIHAIRGGGVVGEHTVSFFGEDEIIEVTHKALSKSLFCRGALKAAEFIVNKKSGLYNLDDIF